MICFVAPIVLHVATIQTIGFELWCVLFDPLWHICRGVFSTTVHLSLPHDNWTENTVSRQTADRAKMDLLVASQSQ